jgi:hypothetical protein
VEFLLEIGIGYNSELQQFENIHDSQVEGYPLKEFIDNYYSMEFQEFRKKVHRLLHLEVDNSGYLVYSNIKLSIRDLAFFANKEMKFIRELQSGREKGNWVKSICKDVNITTSQTSIIADFIDSTIRDENLTSKDIIMLKYLKRVGQDLYHIYKIFHSVDVRDKNYLFHIVNVYSEGFFGQNEDCRH